MKFMETQHLQETKFLPKWDKVFTQISDGNETQTLQIYAVWELYV